MRWPALFGTFAVVTLAAVAVALAMVEATRAVTLP